MLQKNLLKKSKQHLPKWVERQYYPGGTEVNISQEKLLRVEKGARSVRRIYHGWNPSTNKDDQVFPRLAQAEFVESVLDEDHAYEPFALHFFGERETETPKNDQQPGILTPIVEYFNKDTHASITLRFNNISRNGIMLGVHFWITKEGRTLYVEDLENITEVRFTEPNGRQDIYIELQREGYIKDFKRAIIEEGEKQILIEHEGVEAIDRVVIPKGLKDQEIIAELFDDGLLDKPFESPPSADDSWRYAGIQQITGIEWKTEIIPQAVSTKKPTEGTLKTTKRPTSKKFLNRLLRFRF
jgi:hypothetical protein